MEGLSETRPAAAALAYFWEAWARFQALTKARPRTRVPVMPIYVIIIWWIVNKLGYGSYSTVWLVKDQRLDRYASLKIVAANSSKDTSASEVLLHLGRKRKREGGSIPPGNEFVLEVLDEFEIQGPNGTHRCTVTEPLGPSITNVLEFTDGWRLPPDVSRKVAAQLAQGVAFLHACGIVHGDLHQGNLLFCIPGMDRWSEEEVYECFGEPYLSKITRYDGQPCMPHAPEYAVRPVDPEALVSFCLTASAHVKIVDFGESLLSTGMPAAITLSTPILSGCVLFPSFDKDRKRVLREMVLMFGKFPDRWWEKWEKRSEYFAEDGTYTGEGTVELGLKVNLQCLFELLEPEEVAAVEKMMGAMLRLEPEERVSADEVLRMLPCSWV
ncbi:hypothetical protein RUND412_010365 [Rhizina undulata]